MYNMSHRLFGLPDEHAFNFKTKIVEHWAPEAMEHIDTSHKLSQLAKWYPAFTARVKPSFYSPIELAKVRTRVDFQHDDRRNPVGGTCRMAGQVQCPTP